MFPDPNKKSNWEKARENKGKKIAHYLRVSTNEQNLERQMSDNNADQIEGAIRFKEKDSGRIPFKEREKASLLIEGIEKGEFKEVHVHSIDRLGRNTLDIMNTIQFFTDHNVCLVSKQENLRTLNDDGSINQMSQLLIGIMSTLAEWDINRKAQNRNEGIEIAKAKGKYKGRKKGTSMTNDKILNKYKKVVQCLKAGNSLRDTSKLCDVSLSTVQRVKKVCDQEGVI